MKDKIENLILFYKDAIEDLNFEIEMLESDRIDDDTNLIRIYQSKFEYDGFIVELNEVLDETMD